MQRSRQAKKNAGQRRDPEQSAMAVIRSVGHQARIFKRTLCSVGVISTSALGFIGVTNVASSGNATSAVNWSSYEAIALEFRVIAVEVNIMPIVNAQTTPTTPAPSLLAICAFSSDDLPTTFGQVAQGPGGKTKNGYRPITFAASAKDFPNAMLWTPSSGAVPTANLFGVMLADPGSVPASTASIPYFRIVVRYAVEFRSLD